MTKDEVVAAIKAQREILQKQWEANKEEVAKRWRETEVNYERVKANYPPEERAMMKPDGTWVCPICSQDKRPGTVRVDVSGPTCWHGDNGCSTWYGGRLLHLSKEEVQILKAARGGTGDLAIELWIHGRHLQKLGFLIDQGLGWSASAEGENLCRHLWGMPQ